MGTTTIVVGDDTLSATAFTHLSDVRDLQDKDYPIAARWLQSNENLDGGELIVIPWDVFDHSVPTRLVTGYEKYDDSFQPTMKPGTQTPAFVVQPILISFVDQTKNAGKGKQIDLAKRRTENTDRAMNRDIQKMLLKGALASPGGGGPTEHAGVPGYEDFFSLNGTDFSTGLIEVVASGTNTLHGLPKSSFPVGTHPQLHNVYFDSANLAGTNLLNQMYGTVIKLGIRGGRPNRSENDWYVSENAANHLKRALRPQERYMNSDELDDGRRMALTFHGIPITPTEDLPQDGQFTTASPWSVLLLNWKRGVKARLYNGWKMQMKGFVEIPGTAGVRAALMMVGGNTIAQQPGLCGVIERAEIF